MPYESNSNIPYEFFSVGTGDWIDYEKPQEKYKYVLGILVDTKYLINTYAKQNVSETEKLSVLIENSIDNYLK